MNIAAKVPVPAAVRRPVQHTSIFAVTGAAAIHVRGGVDGDAFHFDQDTSVTLPDLVAGTDYAVRLVDGAPVATACADAVPDDAIGGFHFAPGGNAVARSGGDAVPAINPASCWDIGFRPTCPDPRGMALVDHDGMTFWCDIYLLGTDHFAKGTSRYGETIADGRSRPVAADGGAKVDRCDFPTVTAIYASHGKQLLTYDEFRIAAHGVTERTAAGIEPDKTGLDAPRTSRFGIMQATGNMWVWGADADPDEPRPSIFGGSWFYGGRAGSRYADLDYWPDYSSDYISTRGRSDHLELA